MLSRIEWDKSPHYPEEMFLPHPLSILTIPADETAMEYPGPVCSVRAFTDLDELTHLSRKDRRDNRKSKNLVTSIYTQSADTYQQCLRIAQAYTIKRNKPTHAFNPMLPHQGVYLLRELVDVMWVDGDGAEK